MFILATSNNEPEIGNVNVIFLSVQLFCFLLVFLILRLSTVSIGILPKQNFIPKTFSIESKILQFHSCWCFCCCFEWIYYVIRMYRNSYTRETYVKRLAFLLFSVHSSNSNSFTFRGLLLSSGFFTRGSLGFCFRKYSRLLHHTNYSAFYLHIHDSCISNPYFGISA